MPGTAAKHVSAAISVLPWRTVSCCTGKVLIKAIEGELTDIPDHIVEPELVGLVQSNHAGVLRVILTRHYADLIFGFQSVVVTLDCSFRGLVGDAGVAARLSLILTPVKTAGSSGPRCIFPFGFTRQAIMLASLFVQPFYIGLRGIPVDAGDWLIIA